MSTNLNESLAETLLTDEVKDSLESAGDLALDVIINSGALDGVPVIGQVRGFVKARNSMRDALYLRKVVRFIRELHQADLAKRTSFVAELQRKGEVDRFGENVFLMLDKMDDVEKPAIAGRLVAACIEGKIDLETALRLCAIINRCYMTDLRLLTSFESVKLPGPMTPIAEALAGAGLLSNAGMVGGDGSPYSSGLLYRLNEYGEALRTHGLV